MADISIGNEDEHPKLVVRMPKSVSQLCLPTGWIAVNHKSGGIVYLHKESRVVTWSRPYCLEKQASVRKHEVPTLSIPCLYQKLNSFSCESLKKKRKFCESPTLRDSDCDELNMAQPANTTATCDGGVENETTAKDVVSSTTETIHKTEDSIMVEGVCTRLSHQTEDEKTEDGSITMATVVVKDTTESSVWLESESEERIIKMSANLTTVSPHFLHGYLNEIFEFDMLSDEQSRLPLYSDSFPVKVQPVPSSKKKGGVTTDGKTPIQILNELCQRTIKEPIKFRTIDSCTRLEVMVEVLIGNLKYGIGKGDNLKQAKHQASSSTIDILDPTLMKKTSEVAKGLQVLDGLPIEGRSVLVTLDDLNESEERYEYPYDVMIKILKRHYTEADNFKRSEIEFDVVKKERKEYSYHMKCRDLMTSGVCRKRKYAKHLASQTLLQQLYPTLKCWGSVVRLSQVLAHIVSPSEQTKSLDEPTSSRSEVLIDALKSEMRKIADTSSPQSHIN